MKTVFEFLSNLFLIAKTPKKLDIIHYNSGLDKMDRGDFEGAIVDFSKSIEINSKDEAAYDYRASSRLRVFDYRGAIEDYSKVIELNPQNPAAYSMRYGARVQIRDPKSSEDLVKYLSFKEKVNISNFNRGRRSEHTIGC